MALPSQPNRTIPGSTKQGDEGWPVYALQAGLDAVDYKVDADGDFGPLTDKEVRAFQKNFFLVIDGIAGEATQKRITALIDAETHTKHRDLPVGLLRGFAESEGGNNLGAVNWNVPGGVDCGIVQIRCYGPPYDMSEMKTAYHPAKSMDRVAVTFLGRVTSMRTMEYAKSRKLQFAQRCAALSWNWPWAAEQYAKFGKLPNPDNNASWATYVDRGVTKRIKFPDGAPVMTYKDWAEFYALGGKHGEGRVTRFVDW